MMNMSFKQIPSNTVVQDFGFQEFCFCTRKKSGTYRKHYTSMRKYKLYTRPDDHKRAEC